MKIRFKQLLCICGNILNIFCAYRYVINISYILIIIYHVYHTRWWKDFCSEDSFIVHLFYITNNKTTWFDWYYILKILYLSKFEFLNIYHEWLYSLVISYLQWVMKFLFLEFSYEITYTMQLQETLFFYQFVNCSFARFWIITLLI